MIRRSVSIAALAVFMMALARLGAADDHERVSRVMAEAPQIKEVALSPDAAWVVYTVAMGSVDENRYTTDPLLQRTAVSLTADGAGASEPVRIAQSIGDAPVTFTPRWRPDGRALAYFDEAVPPSNRRPLVQYVIDSGARLPIPGEIGADYRWSPSSARLAFTARLREGNGIDKRRGLVATVQWSERYSPAGPFGLFIQEVASGAREQVSAGDTHILRFDWSPDERSLVVSATPDADGVPTFRTDLFVIDRASHAVRPLVVQPGLDDAPHWSPDGRWIAFSSLRGVQAYNYGRLAIVPAEGGAITYVGTDLDAQVTPLSAVFWSADSRTVYFSGPADLRTQVFRADVSTKHIVSLSPDDAINEAHVSTSRDGRVIAFTRESLTTPADVFIRTLPDGAPRALTHVGDRVSLASQVRVDRVSWPSRDGRFTIHGVLLTPRAAWQKNADGTGTHIATPLPTLVYYYGGPSMFVSGFAEDGHNGAQVPLAARGYAVLAANTRGRGGYGQAFQLGIRDGQSVGRLPYEDAMGGLDLLIARGIADPQRLGVYGHSYGGFLTAYTITQTDRFKAAVIHEGHEAEWLNSTLEAAPGSDWALLFQDLAGVRNPFDPAERARLIAEAPALNMDRVKTPTLLQYGFQALADRVGRRLFGGLQRFHVPSEFVIYDENHNFVRPAAIADSLTKTGDWFDRWIPASFHPSAGQP